MVLHSGTVRNAPNRQPISIFGRRVVGNAINRVLAWRAMLR
jgi:hypothetical protein